MIYKNEFSKGNRKQNRGEDQLTLAVMMLRAVKILAMDLGNPIWLMSLFAIFYSFPLHPGMLMLLAASRQYHKLFPATYCINSGVFGSH